MTTDQRTELAYLRKKVKQQEDLIRFVIKRLPGVKTISNLELFAYIADDAEAGAGDFLRRLAKRLEELRKPFYGPRKPYKRYLVEE